MFAYLLCERAEDRSVTRFAEHGPQFRIIMGVAFIGAGIIVMATGGINRITGLITIGTGWTCFGMGYVGATLAAYWENKP